MFRLGLRVCTYLLPKRKRSVSDPDWIGAVRALDLIVRTCSCPMKVNPVKMKSSLFLIAVTTVILPVSGFAQVTFFGAQKTIFYKQTKENVAPTTPTEYSLFAFADTTNAGQTDSFTVSAVDTVSLTSSGGQNFAGSIFYTSKQALDAGFPVGDNYLFTAVGGSLGGESDQLPIMTAAYPPILYLPGTELAKVSHIRPNLKLTFTFASSGTGAAPTLVSFAILDSSGAVIYEQYAAVGTTSFTIPKSEIDALTPGTNYTGELSNFNTKDVGSSGSFSTAADSDGFVSSTLFRFRVK